MPRLFDQRDIHRATTVNQVRARWAEHAAKHRLELVADDRTVAAYVNYGRWVADCPECNGGIACWDQNPAGCCLDCGHIFTVEFPADADAATRVLAKRTRPANRNWRPDQQDVDALRRENTLMGGR